MANLRTGHTKGYRGQKGGAHQIPWRQDQEILRRIAEASRLRSEQLRTPEIAARLGVSEYTVLADLQHDLELQREGAETARERHIANLEQQSRGHHEELARIEALLQETSERSLNVSGLVSARIACRREIRQIELDIGKYDGSLVERQRVEVEATLHNGDRDLDSEIEQLLGDRVVARPRLVVEGPPSVAPPGSNGATPAAG